MHTDDPSGSQNHSNTDPADREEEASNHENDQELEDYPEASSERMSDTSSTYSDSSGDFNPGEDEIPQDILGPEDGQGAINVVDDLGYANW